MSEEQVIVTGASRGIGAAIAVELARGGFTVAALSRSGQTPVGYSLVCDVSDQSSVSQAVACVAARGPIVGLVNNAGSHFASPSRDLSAAELERSIRLNATSVVVACREAYSHLVAAGGGLIVNIGSFFDKLAVPENVRYCASKAAVGVITRCLASEWAKDNIRVLDVAPGYIETETSIVTFLPATRFGPGSPRGHPSVVPARPKKSPGWSASCSENKSAFSRAKPSTSTVARE
jgi:NAD(P)-dependent dehydrogenase (short-subunit alcohol dehydrogenase family)